MTDRFGEIPIAPKALAPQELLKIWEFLTNHAAGAALKDLGNIGNAVLRLHLDEKMHMVRLDT